MYEWTINVMICRQFYVLQYNEKLCLNFETFALFKIRKASSI